MAENPLVLNSYTVPLNTKEAKIAQIIATKTTSYQLIHDPSGLFEIKGNGIFLKKEKEINSNSPMIFSIRIQEKGSQTQKSFELVKDEFVKNKVIAHRGAWKKQGFSHNSIGSISQAIKLGCEATEIDIWLTKDKEILLCHDLDLDGKIIEQTNLDELQKVKLKNNEVAPTLKEILKLLKTQNQMKLVIELKSNKDNDNIVDLANATIQLVNEMNAQAWVSFISFDYRGLKRLRVLDATAHLSFLEPSVPLDCQKLDGMTGIDYHYRLFDKDQLFERCRALGLTTNAWTVNDRETMRYLLQNNIDFITTDEPEILLDVISKQQKI